MPQWEDLLRAAVGGFTMHRIGRLSRFLRNFNVHQITFAIQYIPYLLAIWNRIHHLTPLYRHLIVNCILSDDVMIIILLIYNPYVHACCGIRRCWPGVTFDNLSNDG